MASLPFVSAAGKTRMWTATISAPLPGNSQAVLAAFVRASQSGLSIASAHGSHISNVGGLALDNNDWRNHGATPSSV